MPITPIQEDQASASSSSKRKGAKDNEKDSHKKQHKLPTQDKKKKALGKEFYKSRAKKRVNDLMDRLGKDTKRKRMAEEVIPIGSSENIIELTKNLFSIL